MIEIHNPVMEMIDFKKTYAQNPESKI